MRLTRAVGILLHPTSLPGPFGIGDLGPEVERFLDFLSETGQHWWQVLPLGPTGAGNSPYQSHSSFAGSPLLISPERMVEQGFLRSEQVESAKTTATAKVDYSAVSEAKDVLFRLAFQQTDMDNLPDFHVFEHTQASWLEDFALYMALKHEHGGAAWSDWEPGLVIRQPEALESARERLADEILYHKFIQFLFTRQWSQVRDSCRRRGIQLIGDLPIYVAGDSADVWARRDLFELDDLGRPTVVAGVPPDLFSPEFGQRWGNPLYHWDAHRSEGYAWWISRLKATLDRVDLLRLDHFRGFEAYWEIPASCPTAAVGRWVPGPGAEFLEAARTALGGLPLIAEDLGIITPEVEALRDNFGLPGMKILQFAFGSGTDSAFLPHRYIPHCVVYTGTHDNDTTIGWYTMQPGTTNQSAEQIEAEHAYLRRYVGGSGEEVHWAMNRLALASVADTSILPMQDVLGLDGSSRMNTPGEATGHWEWRLLPDQIDQDERDRLADMTYAYSRWNGAVPERILRYESDREANLKP